jgi:hypothetical protein
MGNEYSRESDEYIQKFGVRIELARARRHNWPQETAALRVSSKRGSSPTCFAAFFRLRGSKVLRYAVLLDGGFVRRKLGTAAKPVTAHDVGALIASLSALPELAEMRLHRVYF